MNDPRAAFVIEVAAVVALLLVLVTLGVVAVAGDMR